MSKFSYICMMLGTYGICGAIPYFIYKNGGNWEVVGSMMVAFNTIMAIHVYKTEVNQKGKK